MKTIKRFTLDLEPHQELQIPFNSEILGIVSQNNKPQLIVITDSAFSTVKRNLMVVAEGKEVAHRFNRTNCLGFFEYKPEVGANAILCIFDET